MSADPAYDAFEAKLTPVLLDPASVAPVVVPGVDAWEAPTQLSPIRSSGRPIPPLDWTIDLEPVRAAFEGRGVDMRCIEQTAEFAEPGRAKIIARSSSDNICVKARMASDRVLEVVAAAKRYGMDYLAGLRLKAVWNEDIKETCHVIAQGLDAAALDVEDGGRRSRDLAAKFLHEAADRWNQVADAVPETISTAPREQEFAN